MTTQPPAITLKHTYYRCRLGRRQLDGLFATASAGFSTDAVEISTERHNRIFRAPALDHLVAAVRSAPLPGDPDQWSNLTFTAQEASGKCAVSVQLMPEHVEVTVTGLDPTWVYGADAQIRLFLEDEAVGGSSKSRSEAHRKMRSAMGGAFLWTFMIVYAVVWYPGSRVGAPPGATGAEWVNKPLPLGSLLVLAMVALYFAVRTVQHWARDRAGRGRLAVTGELPAGTWWKRLSTAEQLSAVGLLVTALATLGTLVSAGADVFKSD
ncbi:hypothetical protein [Streptomyces chartreusis]|uniref:Uncharacterized protein n=2 Tax=Streptomyces chartreusis TaxID=1969 RepID=A0A7H8T741_STRCX|nr:hypothetical protein [Streptomyces chartreusis]QKZ18808.1 hypothetical protein HUT05_16415 [Streptomyces chartreusis]